MTKLRGEYTGFPNFRPNPPFLADSLPAEWKSPWHQRDLWRQHPFFSRYNRLKGAFPGIISGSLMFAVYLAYDHWNNTSGPQSSENKRLDTYMHDREKRLAAQGIHIGHH